MALLGIDYGSKKIGLAIAHEDSRMALPLRTITSDDRQALVSALRQVCQDHQVTGFVVGLPVSMAQQGTPANQQRRAVDDFIIWLQQEFSLPVFTEDERLTTQLAQRLRQDAGSHQPDDTLAAMLILQSYLDRNISSSQHLS